MDIDSGEALRRVLEQNQASDETFLDVSKLLLLAVLYCKGSRIGKSNLIYPLISRSELPTFASNTPVSFIFLLYNHPIFM